MATPKRKEAARDIQDGPAKVPAEPPADADDAQPTCSQAQDEPRIVTENQAEISLASPEELTTPSYTFDMQASLPAESPSSSSYASTDEDLYSDDRGRIQKSESKRDPEPRKETPSPPNIIETIPRKPLPPKPAWRPKTGSEGRRRSTGGIRELIFLRRAD